MYKLLKLLAKFCAILAGVLLTVITLITCVSVIGRNTTGSTLVGDFELTAVAAGAAIALFLPWCQIKRGNIIVDFYYRQCQPQPQRHAGSNWSPLARTGNGLADLSAPHWAESMPGPANPAA